MSEMRQPAETRGLKKLASCVGSVVSMGSELHQSPRPPATTVTSLTGAKLTRAYAPVFRSLPPLKNGPVCRYPLHPVLVCCDVGHENLYSWMVASVRRPSTPPSTDTGPNARVHCPEAV